MQYLVLLSSGFLYFVSLIWGNGIGFWLCLEMATLLSVCGFFVPGVSFNRYNPLMCFIILSGVSSILLFLGVNNDIFQLFIFLSFLIKLGIFPFMGWVLLVYTNVSWLLLFLLGVVSKVTTLYIPLSGLVGSEVSLGLTLSGLNLVVASSMFWKSINGIKGFVAVSGLGTSSLLLTVSMETTFYSLLMLLICYFISSGVNFLAFHYLENVSTSSSVNGLLFFILLAIPASLSFIYKLVSVFIIMSLPLSFIYMWILFSISEQLFLCMLIVEKSCVTIKVI
uniref:NADH dehydrogenase subunit 2 n=1 Tax=Tetrancistrum nebulosi TaxID=879209 RepID=A0A0U1X141_9PLAT|nr:NADH dehydrogenase subunit 2 [Tetrancistrum nebulosi]